MATTRIHTDGQALDDLYIDAATIRALLTL